MIYKILFFTFFCFTFTFASIQEVRIGEIDSYYKNEISKEELRSIIDEIEDTLESQLGYDVFNYSSLGKPIYLKYIAPLKLEKTISKKTAQLKKKKEKINSMSKYFETNQKRLKKHQNDVKKFNHHINKKTLALNKYIRDINRKKHLTADQYKQAQIHVKNKEKRIKRDRNVLKQDIRNLKKLRNSYNNKVHQFNVKTSEYNMLRNQLNRMSAKVSQVKGKAFGMKEITLKTYYKDGKKVKEKNVKKSMTKIELYGFESRSQLKAILAHEIGHLVGIPHINVKGSLMHPILQKEQIKRLYLNQADRDNFNANF